MRLLIFLALVGAVFSAPTQENKLPISSSTAKSELEVRTTEELKGSTVPVSGEPRPSEEPESKNVSPMDHPLREPYNIELFQLHAIHAPVSEPAPASESAPASGKV